MELCTGYRGRTHPEVVFPDGNCPVCDAEDRNDENMEEIELLKDEIIDLKEKIKSDAEDLAKCIARIAGMEK